MKNARSVVALLFLLIGCDDGGGIPGAGLTTLNPPPNIDAVSCYDIVSSSGGISSECSACCTQHGFPGSTQYDNRCVCGDRRDDSGDSVCADHAASASACMACCGDAGFRGSGFINNGGATSCWCQSRRDAAVCASSLSTADPVKACRICCLNNGYLGSGYTGIEPRECACQE